MSSDDDDSWVNGDDSDSDQEAKQETSPPQQSSDKPTGTPSQEPVSKSEESKPKVDRPRKIYPTDEEMLADFEAGLVEVNDKLKMMRCFNQEELKAVKESELISGMKEFK